MKRAAAAVRQGSGGSLRVLAGALLLCLVAGAASGQATPRVEAVGAGHTGSAGDAGQGCKWAVVVGADYREPGSTHTRLNYTVSDARLFLDTLDIAPQRAALLVSGGDAAPTRQRVMDAVEQTARRAGPQDVFFFYFAGHGRESNGQSYLAPVDARYEDLGSYVSLTELRKLLSDRTKCRARAKVLVLDACHSGSARGDSKPFETSFAGINGLVTIAACQVNQSSWEFPDLQHGVFTYYLAEGLNGAAAPNSQDLVFLGQLRDYVTRMVEQRTKDCAPPQIPVFVLPPDFVDAPVARRRPEMLAKLEGQAGRQLEAREPLKPGVLVIATDPAGNVDPFFEGRLQHELVQLGYPVVSREASAQFLKTLRDPKDTEAAASAAKRMQARFLLRVVAQLSPPRFDGSIGRYIVTCTVNATVLDVYGNVQGAASPDAADHANAGSGGSAELATERSRQTAIENLLPDLEDDLDRLLKGGKPAAPDNAP